MNEKTTDDNGPLCAYCKPELTEIPYLQMIRGTSCIGIPDSGEGDCAPDLFTAEYGD